MCPKHLFFTRDNATMPIGGVITWVIWLSARIFYVVFFYNFKTKSICLFFDNNLVIIFFFWLMFMVYIKLCNYQLVLSTTVVYSMITYYNYQLSQNHDPIYHRELLISNIIYFMRSSVDVFLDPEDIWNKLALKPNKWNL